MPEDGFLLKIMMFFTINVTNAQYILGAYPYHLHWSFPRLRSIPPWKDVSLWTSGLVLDFRYSRYLPVVVNKNFGEGIQC